jgi:hypothetical protein
MKFVYVLKSNDKDLYFNQALISMYSLRRIMPDAEIDLIVDTDTFNGLRGERSIPQELAVNVITVSVPSNINKKIISRYLKMKSREIVNGNFAYIDCDTVICEPIEELDCELGMVIDKHLLLPEHPIKEGIENNAMRCGFHAGYNERHYNSGFIWCKDTERVCEFFEKWLDLYMNNTDLVTQDQASMNEVNWKMQGFITELPASYNCQVSTTGSFVQYLQDVKVLHYFATGVDKGIPYDLANEKILKQALVSPMTDDIIDIISRPKEKFSCVRYAGTDATIEKLLQTRRFIKLKREYEKNNLKFNCKEKILVIKEKIVRKLGGKE